MNSTICIIIYYSKSYVSASDLPEKKKMGSKITCGKTANMCLVQGMDKDAFKMPLCCPEMKNKIYFY